MNTTYKVLVCAATLALAACGNKGPLVQADSPQAQGDDAQATPSDTSTQPATTPESAAPDTTTPATTEPVEPSLPADPAVPPTDGDDDGAG